MTLKNAGKPSEIMTILLPEMCHFVEFRAGTSQGEMAKRSVLLVNQREMAVLAEFTGLRSRATTIKVLLSN